VPDPFGTGPVASPDLALANLVSNALRYGRETITLTAQQPDEQTRLTVSDEGRGLPSSS
jgi:signal transduction histidine kinase